MSQTQLVVEHGFLFVGKPMTNEMRRGHGNAGSLSKALSFKDVRDEVLFYVI